jgi:hypothetical protein
VTLGAVVLPALSEFTAFMSLLEAIYGKFADLLLIFNDFLICLHRLPLASWYRDYDMNDWHLIWF